MSSLSASTNCRKDDVLFGWQVCNVMTRVLGSNIRFWWFMLIFFFDSQCKGRPYPHLTFEPQSQIPVWYPHRFMKPIYTKQMRIVQFYHLQSKTWNGLLQVFLRHLIIFPFLVASFRWFLSKCHANCETLPVSKRFVTSRADEREMTGKYWPNQHPSIRHHAIPILRNWGTYLQSRKITHSMEVAEHPRSSKMSILLFILSSCFFHSNIPSQTIQVSNCCDCKTTPFPPESFPVGRRYHQDGRYSRP